MRARWSRFLCGVLGHRNWRMWAGHHSVIVECGRCMLRVYAVRLTKAWKVRVENREGTCEVAE